MQSLIFVQFLSRMCSDSMTLLLSKIKNLGFGVTVSKKSIMKSKKGFLLLHLLLFILTIQIILSSNYIQASNIKNSAVVIMYHKFNISQYPSTNITLEQFESHLKELTDNNFNVLPLDYIVDTIINDGKLPEKTIGLSVDDADISFLEVAWPRLKALNFPVTLFINTQITSSNSKKYLNWEDIRKLHDEGVAIGAHSHTHDHLTNKSIEELKNEIETSNKIFLKELGKIPSLFAYPYGETDERLFSLLKDYKYKVAFGQHSGVINETSNMYFLPRFSLNEKYGDLERFKFIINSKGLGIYDFVPSNPNIIENPPYIGFSLLDQSFTNIISCYIYDAKGQIKNDLFKFNERVEIRLHRKLEPGRSRLNCTVKDKNKNWRWFGSQFYVQENN